MPRKTGAGNVIRPLARRRRALAHRLSDTPVIAAGAVAGYGPIFNAGAVAENGLLHLLARGVRDCYRANPQTDGPRFLDYISDVLAFTSRDGRDYRFQRVLIRGAQGPTLAYEDPRVQRIASGGGQRLLMTYTNLPDPAYGDQPWRIGAQELAFHDGQLHLADGPERLLGPPGLPNKDGVVCNLTDGRVALFHRIRPKIQLAVFDSLDALYDADEDYWAAHVRELDRHTLLAPDPAADCVGAGAPPVATRDGLLFFYHQREGDGQYTMRLALLDGETGQLKAKLAEPLLRAEHAWERVGDVNEVIFVQGAVPRSDGLLYLTYGAADRHVGAAVADPNLLLAALRRAA